MMVCDLIQHYSLTYVPLPISLHKTLCENTDLITQGTVSLMYELFHSLDLDVSFSKVDYTVREDAGPLEVVLTASRSASFEYSVTVIPTAGSANGELWLQGLPLWSLTSPVCASCTYPHHLLCYSWGRLCTRASESCVCSRAERGHCAPGHCGQCRGRTR